VLRWPRRDSGKRAGGLVAGMFFFVAGWSGIVETGRVGCCWIGTGRIGAGTSTLCSGAGCVMSGTLRSGAGSGGANGGAVTRFKIWAIWM
jgi:hypothetical protein